MNCVTTTDEQNDRSVSVVERSYRREVRGRDCITTIVYDTPELRLEEVTLETLEPSDES